MAVGFTFPFIYFLIKLSKVCDIAKYKIRETKQQLHLYKKRNLGTVANC